MMDATQTRTWRRSSPPQDTGRCFLGLFVLLVPALMLSACRLPPAGPSIILIFTDDQRADTLGCMGNTVVPTPHTDRLAREGTLFEKAFVITSLCGPSRATVLSGLYTHLTGVSDNKMDLDYGSTAILPGILGDAGYATAFIGKYHLSDDASPRPGFDHWISYEGQGDYIDSVLNINGEMTETSGYSTDLIVRMATDWIREQGSRPFFLLLSLKNPHGPLIPPHRHRGLLADVRLPVPRSYFDPVEKVPGFVRWGLIDAESEAATESGMEQLLRKYLKMIPAIDDAVGQVYETLEQQGILDDTALIFSSDNGRILGEHRFLGKGIPYEPSLHVPMIVRMPGRFAAGLRVSRQVLNLDLPPTILELAGVPVPAAMRGRSLLALGTGEEAEDWRRDWLYIGNYSGILRADILAVRDDEWKYVRYNTPDGIQEELFDLGSDPDERANLVADAAHSSRLVAMQQRMRALMAEEGVPAGWWD